jgi:thiol-disulfide isomerase/thioredoxin
MSRRPISQTRQVIAAVIVGAACLLIAIQYARLITPAAAREIQAACNGLRPSPDNPIFGDLPSSQPVDFTAQNYKGESVSLSDYRGKVVFVNFWATWCGVCKAEKPGLEDMVSELEGDDFVVLTLASDPQWQNIQDYFPKGSPLTVLLDPPSGDENLGTIAKSFGITAVPESCVFDRQGRIRYYFINKRDWDSGVAQTCMRALIDED